MPVGPLADRSPTALRPIRTTDMTCAEVYDWSQYQDDAIHLLICRAIDPEKIADQIAARILDDGSIRNGAEGAYCLIDDYGYLMERMKTLGETIAAWQRPDPGFDLTKLPASQLRDDLALEVEP